MSTGTLEKLNDLVKLEEVHRAFPLLPKPQQIKISEIRDSTGEDAYQIVITYPDSVKDKDIGWEKIHPLVEWIRERIFKNRDSDRWPYFRLGRESDFKQAA